MRKIHIVSLFLALITLLGCREVSESTHTFDVSNLTDADYPDNPDIGFRSSAYKSEWFSSGSIDVVDAGRHIVDLHFLTLEHDTISLSGLDVSEYMPTIPDVIKKDSYLTHLACINQEWNRNQVRYKPGEYQSSRPDIVRVDVARNCLNAYLWEVIIYIQEDGQQVPYAHGWFDFPHELYAQFFESKNGMAYEPFKKSLENWVDPANEKVDLGLLRQVNGEVQVEHEDFSDAMYPLAGARKKKYKEIIHPPQFETMRDLQDDATRFATFTPPGFYNKKDPRVTELGRLYTLESIHLHTTQSKVDGSAGHEVELRFLHKDGKKRTRLYLGGLDFSTFPVLAPADANKGWKSSMGISNHTFYEDYSTHQRSKAQQNPYYAMLTDDKGQWLDSHKIGIDGPIFHFADEARSELHLWLLSFERHALVGHYVIHLDEG